MVSEGMDRLWSPQSILGTFLKAKNVPGQVHGYELAKVLRRKSSGNLRNRWGGERVKEFWPNIVTIEVYLGFCTTHNFRYRTCS